MKMIRLAAAFFVALNLVAASRGQEPTTGDAGESGPPDTSKFYKKPGYSPWAGRVFPQVPLWGDQHLHSGWSMDAGISGATLSPEDAVRFARGEEVTASSGQPAKLARPLDFLVVADHSDNMGFFPDLFSGKPELLADPTGKKWYDQIKSGKGAEAAIDIITSFSSGTFPKDLMYSPDTRPY